MSEVLYAESVPGVEAALARGGPPLPPATLVALSLGKASGKSRRDRSLGVLTQRFLKLFLLDRKVRRWAAALSSLHAQHL